MSQTHPPARGCLRPAERKAREVHLRTSRLTILALVAIWAGCRSEAATPPQADHRTVAAAGNKTAPTDPADLCRARSRCAIAGSVPVTAVPGTTLVTVRIGHAPSAASDEEKCDRREYWVSRPAGDILVAADCEVQWGADNPGPVTVQLRGTELDVRYVEFQSSDGCESYGATVSLAGPKITALQTRKLGTVKKNVCRPSARSGVVDPLGDGSAAHPLLTPHR